MSSAHPNRRSRWNIFKIEEEFQKEQVLKILACLSFYVAVSTIIVCVFFVYYADPEWESGSRSFWATVGVIASTWGDRLDLQRLAISWAVSMAGLSTIFAAVMGTYFSHQISGPVYRLKKDLDLIAATGSIREITLRDGDALQDLAESVNDAFVAVRGESTAESGGTREIVDELRKHLASFQQDGMCEPDAQRVEAWLEGIRRLVDPADPEAESTP